jgi:hypothetical protein
MSGSITPSRLLSLLCEIQMRDIQMKAERSLRPPVAAGMGGTGIAQPAIPTAGDGLPFA